MITPSPEFADEVLRQAELRLQAQMELAISADQRSITFIGITGGAAIALVAAGAAVITGEHSNLALGLSFIAASSSLFAGAVLAGLATRPIAFHIPGTRPSLLESNVNFPVAQIKLVLAQRYEERMRANSTAMERNAHRVSFALLLAPLSVPIGAAIYAICRYVGL